MEVADNSQRAEPAQRTHCPAGHPYDETNTYIYNDARKCRTCRNHRRNRYRDKGYG